MNARPSGRARRPRPVIVAAGVVEIPAQIRRRELVLRNPVRKSCSIKRTARLCAALHRNGEFSRTSKLADKVLKSLVLFVVTSPRADFGLQSVLPAAMQEQTLLRRKAQAPLVPLSIFQNPEFCKKFSHECCTQVGNRDVVRRPGVSRD